MMRGRWTFRSTEWQITKGVKSTGRLKRPRRDVSVDQPIATWIRTAKDIESWRTLAGGYFLQRKDI